MGIKIIRPLYIIEKKQLELSAVDYLFTEQTNLQCEQRRSMITMVLMFTIC